MQVAPVLLFAGIAVMIADIASDGFQDLASLLLCAIAIIFAVAIIFILPRKLKFRRKSLVVERLFKQRQCISYCDIADITPRVIEVRNSWNVPLVNLQNADAVQEALEEVEQKGLVPDLDPEMRFEEKMSSRYAFAFKMLPVGGAVAVAAVWAGLCPSAWDREAFMVLVMLVVVAPPIIVHQKRQTGSSAT